MELFSVAVLAASDGIGELAGDGEKQPESYEFKMRNRLPGQRPCGKNVQKGRQTRQAQINVWQS